MEGPSVLFRADASGSIGTGHVMRCIALAQELRNRSCRIHFVSVSPPDPITARLETEGFDIHTLISRPGSAEDALETCRLAISLSASVIVLDGYQFSSGYQQEIKDQGFLLLCVDDYGYAGQYPADIILNQNLYAAEKNLYQQEAGNTLLLGPGYALLRAEIIAGRTRIRSRKQKAGNILVTLGGSDPDNVTMEVVKALQTLPKNAFTAKVLIGGVNPHGEEILKTARSSGHSIRVIQNAANMAGLLSWADIAVTSGGSTTLELAYFGIPMVTVVIADNQKRVCDALLEKEAGINLGSPDAAFLGRLVQTVKKLLVSPELCRNMSRNAMSLVDGKGAGRVSDILCRSALILTKAKPADCSTVFAWINDPYVREVSFTTKPVLWDEHMQWFLQKISDPDTRYFIVRTAGGIPVGQVRYDLSGTDATISILVDPGFRRRHLGTLAMRLSARELFCTTAVAKIHAYIKPSNEISCRAFEKAGYQYAGTLDKEGNRARHMILSRM